MADKNGGVARALTFGAAAKRLRDNGYHVVSALAPSGESNSSVAAAYRPTYEALISEHPVAVAIAILALAPIEDEELDKRVRAALGKRGLLRGPVRIGSDGVELRPLNLADTISTLVAEIDGAVALIGSAALPVDAKWNNGTLLEVPLSALPRINGNAVRELFDKELRFLPGHLAHEREPPRKPSRLGFVGR